ncbi:MAG: hypothetical protein Q8P21_00785 [bacterium]|nr:hypothetical protein [bacterium]
MKEKFKKFWSTNPKIKKATGAILVIVGLISIITPFTPVGFLLIFGLEMLGVRLLLWDKIKSWFKR